MSVGDDYGHGWLAGRASLQAHVDALEAALRDLLTQWRNNADMLAEGNKGEHFDPSVGMQRACADQLGAALTASVERQPGG